MPQLIHKLALQAGMKHPVMGEISYNCFSYEKFAELIVQECIRKQTELDDAVVVYSLGEGVEVTKEQLILRHFGIEQ